MVFESTAKIVRKTPGLHVSHSAVSAAGGDSVQQVRLEGLQDEIQRNKQVIIIGDSTLDLGKK